MNPRSLMRFALVCLLTLMLGACASSGSARTGGAQRGAAGVPMPAPDTRTEAGAYTGVSEYRMGPQDLIEVSVFQVDELNRTVRVNTLGQISLPLIGVVQAGGLTAQELEKLIAAKLDASFLQNPQVTVFVKEYASQRITMEGAINKPGIYPISGRTSLLQAIAMGGGVTNIADLQGIVVFRQVDGKKMGAKFDLKAIRAGTSEDPQIYGDDIIVVDESGSKSALRRFIETLPVFSFFGIF